MVYTFRRGTESVTCETRRNPDGPGFQLVVTQNGQTHIEPFETVTTLLAREYEWLEAWRAHGWREEGLAIR